MTLDPAITPSSTPTREDGRTVWLGTSWKMTKTLLEATTYVEELCAATTPPGVQPFLLPAHTALAAVRDALPAGSAVLLGAQNAHWAPEGAGTGEVSMRMVADAGAHLVELGHSERREAFAETDATVALKVRAACQHGLVPLVCVGEPAAVRGAGEQEAFVVAQVRAALVHLRAEQVASVVIAYEPVWAIGAQGRPATPEEVAPVMAALARALAELSDGRPRRALLYGGSVDPDNAGALLEVPHTDGLFIGRAAWTAAGFRELLSIAGEHAARRHRRSTTPAPRLTATPQETP